MSSPISLFLAACALFASLGCGSRSDLPPALPSCETDDDCDRSNLCALEACVAGSCQKLPTVECVAPDSCSLAACNAVTGACEISPITPDEDRDGFPAPLPGHIAGDAGACGTDCDDTSAQAFPGQLEICDGVDNDCDGIVDNGSRILPNEGSEAPDAVAVQGPDKRNATSRGIAFGSGYFFLSYGGVTTESNNYIQGIDTEGAQVFPETEVTPVNVPSFGGSVVWTGRHFGIMWNDARIGTENYEMFFSLFDALGEKKLVDQQISFGNSFSINESLIYDQGRFVSVWDDWRSTTLGSSQRLFGQIIESDGTRKSPEIQVSPEGRVAQFPSLAANSTSFAVASLSLDGYEQQVFLGLYDKSFQGRVFFQVPATFPQNPRVTTLGEHFLVTWEVYSDTGPGNEIWGTVYDDGGGLLIPPTSLVQNGLYVRGHTTLTFGDRVLLSWSDYRDGNFEIYANVVQADLSANRLFEAESPMRLTVAEGDSLSPHLARSDRGQVGLFFDDRRTGELGAYFGRFGCGSTLP